MLSHQNVLLNLSYNAFLFGNWAHIAINLPKTSISSMCMWYFTPAKLVLSECSL